VFIKVTVMSTKGRGFLLAAGVMGLILTGTAPALAQSHGGGHGGGGHAAGAHVGGGGHASAGHFGGSPHYAAAGGYRGYGGAGYAHGYAAGFHGSAGVYGRGYGGYGYGRGYSTGAYWRGGYWHGGFWPRAYYGVGFAWFLPVLPLAYATYWYGGIPYYYANDVYYTYNPSYEGYVATDPPPVADSSAPADGGRRPAARRPQDRVPDRDPAMAATLRVRFSCTPGMARPPTSRPKTRPNASSGPRSRPGRWRRTGLTTCAQCRPVSRAGDTARGSPTGPTVDSNRCEIAWRIQSGPPRYGAMATAARTQDIDLARRQTLKLATLVAPGPVLGEVVALPELHGMPRRFLASTTCSSKPKRRSCSRAVTAFRSCCRKRSA